jgi:hypothetical protein
MQKGDKEQNVLTRHALLTYTLMRVRVTTVTVEKQRVFHILSVSTKSALSLDVPKTWFNDWPDDDSESKHVATFDTDNKLVVF